MHNQLQDGRNIRVSNVIADFTPEILGIEEELSLPLERIFRSLDQIISWRSKFNNIQADSESELVSGRLIRWIAKHQIHIAQIQPGKPKQNAYVELLNHTVRYRWSSQHN